MSGTNKTTPYVGYNKMMRLETSVKKTLSGLGSTVDLRYATYNRIEKLALLLSIARVLRARVDNTKINKINSNPYLIAHVYKVMILINEGMPLIISRLDKGRFFSLLLLDGGVAGRRLLKKPNLRVMLRETFPHCFAYNEDAAADQLSSRLVRVCGLVPKEQQSQEQEQEQSQEKSQQQSAVDPLLDSIPTLVAAGALMFIAGATYCWLVLVGLRRL